MIIDEKIFTHTLAHYTHLHCHPELSFQEKETRQYIEGILKQSGIAYEIVADKGIIGLLPGHHSSHTIALRADMDALPLQENHRHNPCSRITGIMHACGHDIHTACLLGAAEFFQLHPELPRPNILLIFQHAEEVLPGGALDILGSHFFKTHCPEWIIGQHAEPELPVGSVGLCPGEYMASGDEIFITLRGPGGHAALPEQTTDLILIASHIVIALQQIASRQAPPQIPTVLTFGNICCQSAMNIIPKEIKLEGTFRTFDKNWRIKAKENIRRIATALAESMGAEVEINIAEGYPGLYNDPEKTQTAIQVLKKNLGAKNVILLPKRMTTEDFARYSRLIPATFLRLGVNGREECGKLHTPDFYADPAALRVGVQTLCSLALSTLTLTNSQ